MWVLSIVNSAIFKLSSVGNTPKPTRASKMSVKLIVRDAHRLVNELWSPLEQTKELQIKIF